MYLQGGKEAVEGRVHGDIHDLRCMSQWRGPVEGRLHGAFATLLCVFRGERRQLRAGYMGHITQLANTLHIASEERPEVAEHVRGDQDWQHYLTSSLQPQNTVCLGLGLVVLSHRLVCSHYCLSSMLGSCIV